MFNNLEEINQKVLWQPQNLQTKKQLLLLLFLVKHLLVILKANILPIRSKISQGFSHKKNQKILILTKHLQKQA